MQFGRELRSLVVFLSQFAYGAPAGPRRGSGFYTESAWRNFTTQP